MSPESSAPLMVAPFGLDSLREPAPPAPPPRERGRHAVHSHRRRRSARRLVLLVALLVLLAAAAVFVGVRLTTPDPPPVVTPVVHRTVTVPAQSVSLPWPTTGQAAIAVPSIGIDVASGPEHPAPVASLTKLMTAYVILHDHPLGLNEAGPDITVTQADVDDYNNDTVDDDSNAQVTVGEQLTEQQVLAGLLVHSADNFADLLARWDAGSTPAFVAKMNAGAAQLGMRQSHFADASGVDPGSTSTPADLLKVAAVDMKNPAFASMVQMTSVTLPVAGTISTYTPLLGLQGIIGVKSGFTTAAGGCDVLAVVRTVHGQPVLLLAAVTGQTGPEVLAQAGLHGLALVDALGPLIGSMPVLRGGQVVADVSEAGRSVDARATASVSLLTWPGVTATRVFRPAHHLTDRASRGASAGTVVVTLGTQRVVVPVRLQQEVPRQSLLQRLF
ncbi:MAG: D-alanyl-D-alanine carboxypeptidase family protein [Acidimicrobiales bacterium]